MCKIWRDFGRFQTLTEQIKLFKIRQMQLIDRDSARVQRKKLGNFGSSDHENLNVKSYQPKALFFGKPRFGP